MHLAPTRTRPCLRQMQNEAPNPRPRRLRQRATSILRHHVDDLSDRVDYVPLDVVELTHVFGRDDGVGVYDRVWGGAGWRMQGGHEVAEDEDLVVYVRCGVLSYQILVPR